MNNTKTINNNIDTILMWKGVSFALLGVMLGFVMREIGASNKIILTLILIPFTFAIYFLFCLIKTVFGKN